jgi:hypothetical protein
MKYIVELTISNPSHEHISLRKVQKKTNFVVEANSESEAILRATRKFRSLGNYVHEAAVLNERIALPSQADVKKQGATGAAIKAFSGNKFSTRKDRLDQSKVDAVLGAGKYKAGSADANLALAKHFKDKATNFSVQQDNQTTFTPTAAAQQAASSGMTKPEPEKPAAAKPEKKPGFFKRLGSAIKGKDDGYTVFGRESQKEKNRMSGGLSAGGVSATDTSAVLKNRENLSNIGADAAASTTGPKVKYEIGKSEVSSDEFKKEKSGGNLSKDYKFTLKNKDGSQRVVTSKDADYKSLVGKYVGEQVEQQEYIEEKLKASDPASKWISDFVASDNPKFKGKSKKERIRMALGAHYAAKRELEERVLPGQDPNINRLTGKPNVSKEDPAPELKPVEVQSKRPEGAQWSKEYLQKAASGVGRSMVSAEKAKQYLSTFHKEEVERVTEGKVSGYKMYRNPDNTWYVEDENEGVVLRNASQGEAEHMVWSGNQKLKGVVNAHGDVIKARLKSAAAKKKGK